MPVHDWSRVGAGIFHDFHLAWIAEIRNTLNNGILPEGYYALAEQVAGSVEPDVLTLQAVTDNGTDVSGPESSAKIAVAVAPPRERFTAFT